MNPPGSDNSPPTLGGVSSDDPFAVGGDADGLKRRSVRGSFATVLSQGAKMVIQVGSQIALARLLFPAEYGLIAMAYPVIALVQVFNDIGLGQAIVQRPTLVQEQVSALFWVNIATSCLLACLVALLAPLAAWVYGEPRLVSLTVVLGLTLPMAAASLVPGALFARHMRFGLLARNEVMASLGGAATTIICAMNGLSYWSLVIGQFANLIVGSILIWSACAWRPSRPQFAASVWSDVKFGANITLSNLATFVTTSADNMIVGLTTGKVSLGLYDRSYNLVVRPIGQMLAPMSRVAVPLLSRLVDEPEKYRAAYLQMVRVATLLIVPAMLVCISNAALLIHIFLGPRWSAAAPIFSWLCVGGLTSGIYASTFWLLISQDRSQELRLFASLAAIVNVASYLIGAVWGVIGIAIAASLGFVLLTTPLMLFVSTRHGPVRIRDIIWCSLPYIATGTLVYGILVFSLNRIVPHGLLSLIFVTLTAYGIFVSLSLISAPNRQLLRAAVRSLKGLLPARASVD
jgi:polysaccharide transporter, PST family